MSDLIEKVEKLAKKSDKQGLVKLGAEELGVDLDASKTSAILAEELLAAIEERGGNGPDEGSPHEDPPSAPAKTASKKARRYTGKMLENTRNGRVFPWTAALAKSRHMKEV